MLHCVHQGVASIAIASLITHHFEASGDCDTLATLDVALKTIAWPHYQAWKHRKRECIVPTSSQFDGKRFSRDSWQSFPELASIYKGAMVKYLIFWCRDLLTAQLDHDSTYMAKCRAYAAYCLAEFQYLQEVSGPWLDRDVAERMCYMARSFLSLYQFLAVSTRSECPTKWYYKVVPKFHSLLHLAMQLPLTRRNPRYDHLYSDEDFMRHISKICSRCHASTMDTVALHRYRVLIELCDFTPEPIVAE